MDSNIVPDAVDAVYYDVLCCVAFECFVWCCLAARRLVSSCVGMLRCFVWYGAVW